MTKARDLASNAEGTKPKVIDAAGDLLYGTGSDAATRLAIGTAGQVLTVNSGATAPEWVTPSAAGYTWTRRAAAGSLGFASVFGATYSNSLWLLYGRDSSNVGRIAYSSNGTSWTAVTIGATFTPRTMIYSTTASLYIVAGDSGLLYTSPDLTTWTSRTSGFGTNRIENIEDSGTIIVIAGDSGDLSSSTDGTTWTSRTSNVGGNRIVGLVWGAADSKFVITANNTTALTGAAYSSDGITWTGVTTPTSVGRVFYYNGTFYAFGSTSNVNGASSTDGITWTLFDNNRMGFNHVDNQAEPAVIVNNKLIAVSSNPSNYLMETDFTITNGYLDYRNIGISPLSNGVSSNQSLATNGTDLIIVSITGGAIYSTY